MNYWSVEKSFVQGAIIIRNSEGVELNRYDISMYSVEIVKDSHISIRSNVDCRTVFYSYIRNVVFYTT